MVPGRPTGGETVTGVQLHYPAIFSPGKKLQVPIWREAVWAPELFWMGLWRENSNSPTRIWIHALQTVVIHFNDSIITAHQYL